MGFEYLGRELQVVMLCGNFFLKGRIPQEVSE